MHVSLKRSIGVTALVVGMIAGFSAPASAVGPVSCTGNGPFTSGLDVGCVVGPGLTGIHIVAVGAPGGTFDDSAPGGKGAVVTADLAVAAGTTIFLNIGGPGINGSSVGGINGGGVGGNAHGAAGGGGSDLRTPTNAVSDRVLVAGGGGGGGDALDTSIAPTFAGANADGGSGGFIIGGASAAGNTHGAGGGEPPCVGSPGGPTTSGGVGGNGFGNGGGGGGGYAGGGGGGEIFAAGACDNAGSDGGGGGGSSLVPTGGSKVTDTTGKPMITITAPVPATTTGPTIAGSTVVGQTLTESHAPWSNAPTAITLQWLRCDTAGTACLPIGTGAATYTLTADDVGHTIKAQETATNFYGSSVVAGTAGTATSTPTAVVTAAAIPPPTITASSPACQRLDATVTNNNSTGSAVQYTVTAKKGTTSVSRLTDSTALPGQSASVHISGLPTGGTYSVTANGDDGSVSAQPTTVKVKECVVNDFKVKIGRAHFKQREADVELINRGSNVAVAVTVVSVHHSSHHYRVKANEVRTVEAFIAPHGHSKIKVVDPAGVAARRKFFRN